MAWFIRMLASVGSTLEYTLCGIYAADDDDDDKSDIYKESVVDSHFKHECLIFLVGIPVCKVSIYATLASGLCL